MQLSMQARARQGSAIGVLKTEDVHARMLSHPRMNLALLYAVRASSCFIYFVHPARFLMMFWNPLQQDKPHQPRSATNTTTWSPARRRLSLLSYVS